MTWMPYTLLELQAMISRDLADCTHEQREFFRRTSIEPVKWSLAPWGDEGAGFWAVAVHEDRVLWFNDIEEGFNVSRYVVYGEIPEDEYWCNQDPLRWALPTLQGEPGTQLGPPTPILHN